jgi:hypothetical protein
MLKALGIVSLIVFLISLNEIADREVAALSI